MNADFYDHSNESIEDVMFDIFIDQLHHFAALEDENTETTAWVNGSADRATAF